MERRIYRAGVVTLACVLLVGPAIQAKTIRVGPSADAGYRSIKPAVDAAVDGDVIVVEEGTCSGGPGIRTSDGGSGRGSPRWPTDIS